MTDEDPSSEASLIRPEDRIVEFCPIDTSVAQNLTEHGYPRYLALADEAASHDLVADAGALKDRIRPMSEVPSLQAIGADVLILNGRATRALWAPCELPDVRVLAIPTDAREARLAVEIAARRGHVRALGTTVIGGRRYRFFEVRASRPPRARVYLSPVLGHRGMLRRLEEAGVRAVLLRWFDDLPYVEPGEDIDLLVADEHVEKVRVIITEEPGTLPVDLYSVSGLPGSDREGLACYPPELAQRIVDRAVRHPSGAWVPAPDDHLHSLAHHAVYHKGIASGLPSTLVGLVNDYKPEHDYSGVLADLAANARLEAPRNIEAWDEYLARVGWRPPMDTLRRLSTRNQWLAQRFFPEPVKSSEEPELAVFILRTRALDVVNLDEVRSLMSHLGFEILDYRHLDDEAAARCTAQLRGGNWGKGPYPTSGGTPASLLTVLHYGPLPVEPGVRARYPHLTNRDVLTAKEALRDVVNERLEPSQRCNPIHSSDNEAEAWEYLALSMPAEVPRIAALVEQRRRAYATPVPVIRVLSRGRRAKVEVVEFKGQLAVRKSYGHAFLRHLRREKQITEAMRGLEAIPPILESGENWLIRPYIHDRLQYTEGSPTLIPLHLLREMVRTLRKLHETGYAIIDAKPDNFLLDGDGIKLIDFEFSYKYPGQPPPFHESYTWHGPDEGLGLDIPVGPLSYEHTWFRWTGLSVEDLCYGTFTRQRYLRARYRAARAAGRLVRVTRHAPRRLRRLAHKASTGLRARGRANYNTWAIKRARTIGLRPHESIDVLKQHETI